MPANDTNQMEFDLKGDLQLIEQAARHAGDIALQYFNKDPQVWLKGASRSPVSEADLAVDQYLKQALLKARPDYGWLSEELEDNDERLSKELVFVVDPIDGTRAFIAGTDEWCVAIAVVRAGRPICGVLYAPIRHQCFKASLGEGAYLDHQKLMMPTDAAPFHHVIVPDEVTKSVNPEFNRKITRVKGARSLALRLAGLSGDKLDGVFVRRNSCDWDLAAADIILSEAGYRMTDENMNEVVYNQPHTRHGLLFAAHTSYIGDMIKALS